MNFGSLMRKHFYIYFACLAILGCQPVSEESQEDRTALILDTVAYRSPLLHRAAPNCDTLAEFNCTAAKVSFVQIDQALNHADSAEINHMLQKSLAQNSGDLSSYLNKFIQEYQMILDEEPELLQGQAGWQLNIQQKVICNTDKLFTVSNYIFLFTGGAHGRYSTSFLNIDLSTGRLIKLNDIFKGEFIGELTSIGEHYFRKTYEIEKEANINSTGFWFEDDAFYLPDNYGFSREGIIFLYGTYEVASFADGEPQFMIPYAAIQGFLKTPNPLPIHQLSMNE